MNYDKGLLKLTIIEDEYNSKIDSLENWLCNYFKGSIITILYSGQPTIQAGGTKTLRVDTDKEVVWSIEGDITADITPDGNSVKVKCPNYQSYIDKTLVVKAVTDGTEGLCELTITGGV